VYICTQISTAKTNIYVQQVSSISYVATHRLRIHDLTIFTFVKNSRI